MGAQCKLQPPALGPRSQGPPANGQQREDSWATLNQQGAATATCQCHPQAPGCLPHPTPGPMAQTLEGPPLSPTGTAADCRRRRAASPWPTRASIGDHRRSHGRSAGGCCPAPHCALRRALHAMGPGMAPCMPRTQPTACRPHTALHTQRLNCVFFSAATGGHIAWRPGPESGRRFHRRGGPSRLGRSMSVSQSGAATRSSAPRLPEAAWVLGQAVGLAWVPGTPVHKSWGWPTPEPRCRPRPPGLP